MISAAAYRVRAERKPAQAPFPESALPCVPKPNRALTPALRGCACGFQGRGAKTINQTRKESKMDPMQLDKWTNGELRAAVKHLGRQNIELSQKDSHLAKSEPLERRWSAQAVEKANAYLREQNGRLRQENAALIAKLGEVNALMVKVQTKLDQIKQKKK